MGSNLAKRPLGQPERWIIDFSDMPFEVAETFVEPFETVRQLVKPFRDCNRRETRKKYWWRHGEHNPKLRNALSAITLYFACPEVSKWAIFLPCDMAWLPGNKAKVVVSSDFYLLGILTASVHRKWMDSQKGTLKGDIAYTHTTIFETFPFPQVVAPAQVQQIRQAMTTLNDYRNEVMLARNWGITDLYNAYFHEPASQLVKLHQALDALVLKTYGWKASEDILSNLLDLNLELAEREAAGEKVVGPWAPA
jgi:hypothetical protein